MSARSSENELRMSVDFGDFPKRHASSNTIVLLDTLFEFLHKWWLDDLQVIPVVSSPTL